MRKGRIEKKRLVHLYQYTSLFTTTTARAVVVNAIAASSRPTNLNLMAINELHLQGF
jgi:hypothetical protein